MTTSTSIRPSLGTIQEIREAADSSFQDWQRFNQPDKTVMFTETKTRLQQAEATLKVFEDVIQPAIQAYSPGVLNRAITHFTPGAPTTDPKLELLKRTVGEYMAILRTNIDDLQKPDDKTQELEKTIAEKQRSTSDSPGKIFCDIFMDAVQTGNLYMLQAIRKHPQFKELSPDDLVAALQSAAHNHHEDALRKAMGTDHRMFTTDFLDSVIGDSLRSMEGEKYDERRSLKKELVLKIVPLYEVFGGKEISTDLYWELDIDL